MPAIILFGKRWRLGSDDLLIPAVTLVIIHTLALSGLLSTLFLGNFDNSEVWVASLQEYVVGQVVLLSGSLILEICALWSSCLGGILDTDKRRTLRYIVYIRLGWMIVELAWQLFGVVWITFSRLRPLWPLQCLILLFIVSDWLVLMILVTCIVIALGPPLVTKGTRRGGSVTCRNTESSSPMLDHDKSSRSKLCNNTTNDNNTSQHHDDGRANLNNTACAASLTQLPALTLKHKFSSVCCRHRFVKKHSLSELSGMLADDVLCCVDLVTTDLIAGLMLHRRARLLSQQRIVNEGAGQFRFFIGLDHSTSAIVITIKSNSCLLNILKVMNNSGTAVIPLTPLRQDWMAHKELLETAIYIRNVIDSEDLLAAVIRQNAKASGYELTVVGHSLAAGVAAILTILLQPYYVNIHCFAYSPPNALLSAACAEGTKTLITAVVVGQDIVARIGSLQLDRFRSSLIRVMKACPHTKWRVICGSGHCCHGNLDAALVTSPLAGNSQWGAVSHPDQPIAMCLPHSIMHIVRNHASTRSSLCGRREAVFQAIWANSEDFTDVLVSPVMFADHMLTNVLDALRKVLTHVSPAKPSRKPERSARNHRETPSFDFVCEQQTQSDISGIGVGLSLDCDHLPEVQEGASTVVYRVPLGSSACGADGSYTTVQLRRPVGLIHEKRQFPVVLQHPMLLDLRRDEYQGAAPLASPEVYSETSSLVSFESAGSFKGSSTAGAACGTAGCSGGGYRRMLLSGARLDTIKQSPLNASYSRGFLAHASSPLSPERLTTETSSMGVVGTVSDVVEGEGSGKVMEKESWEGKVNGEPEGALEQTYPAEDLKECFKQEVECATDSRQPLVLNNTVQGRTVEEEKFLCKENKRYDILDNISSDVILDNDLDISLASLPVDDCRVSTLRDDIVVDRDDRRHIDEGRPIAVACDRTMDTDCSSQIALRGADEEDGSSSRYSDCGEEGQRVYDCFVGHYSSAGRGYPHGFSCVQPYHSKESAYGAMDGQSRGVGQRRPMSSCAATAVHMDEEELLSDNFND